MKLLNEYVFSFALIYTFCSGSLAQEIADKHFIDLEDNEDELLIQLDDNESDEYFEILEAINSANSFDSRYAPAPLDNANDFILSDDALIAINNPVLLQKVIKNFLQNYDEFAVEAHIDHKIKPVDVYKHASKNKQQINYDKLIYDLRYNNTIHKLRREEQQKIAKIINKMDKALLKASIIRQDKAAYKKVTKWSNKIMAKAYDGKHKTNLRAAAQAVSYELPRSMRSMGPASHKAQNRVTVIKIAGGLSRLTIAMSRIGGAAATFGTSLPIGAVINHGIIIVTDVAANYARGRSYKETLSQAATHSAFAPLMLIEPFAIAEAIGQNIWNIPIIAGYASIYVTKGLSKAQGKRFIEPVLYQYSGNPKILNLNLERIKYAQILDNLMLKHSLTPMSVNFSKKYERHYKELVIAEMKLIRRTIKYYYRYKINLTLERYTPQQSYELSQILESVRPEMEDLIRLY